MAARSATFLLPLVLAAACAGGPSERAEPAGDDRGASLGGVALKADVFDALDELDAVPFIGEVSLDALLAAIRPRCEPDLATRPSIDSTTFGTSTGGGWTRDTVELEGAMAVTGLTGARLRSIPTTKDASGRGEYDRLRKNSSFEAFSADSGTDQMPRDSASHALREGFPDVVLSIEDERSSS